MRPETVKQNRTNLILHLNIFTSNPHPHNKSHAATNRKRKQNASTLTRNFLPLATRPALNQYPLRWGVDGMFNYFLCLFPDPINKPSTFDTFFCFSFVFLRKMNEKIFFDFCSFPFSSSLSRTFRFGFRCRFRKWNKCEAIGLHRAIQGGPEIEH